MRELIEKLQELGESGNEEPYGLGKINAGMKIPGRHGHDGWWVYKVSANHKQVTVGSAHTGPSPGPKFAGKRYTFRWDGNGYKRQGQYLRPDGIY